LERLAGPRQRPAWFDVANEAVLAGVDVVMSATGPRQLEQATVELLGPQLRRAVREVGVGLWFEWWFQELTGVLADQVRVGLAGSGRAWQGPWLLLHGLTSVGSPALASIAHTALGGVAKDVATAYRGDPAESELSVWLPRMHRIAATGQVWQMRDVYGARFGVVAGFSYPGGVDPSVFLFDIDACGIVELANAGVYDDLSEAAAAWRAMVGEAAEGALPSLVQTPEQLHCLVHWDAGTEILRGSEPDAALDNWFRARRRVHDVAEALRERGTPLPAARSLYHDLDTAAAVEAFTAWYAGRHGAKPDPETADALATEWLEGCLPGTEHAASPHRVLFQQALISDWIDDPVTVAAKALLPEWTRWHAEQAGLPQHLIDRTVAVAVADGHTPTAPHCGPDDL
jgi:hypothetical protein